MKKQKPLTREQYLSKFSRAVRWRLPPRESEDAIADYRELIFQPERDESKLAEELGEPVQAAHLLTDVRTYRRWLALYILCLTIGAMLGFITFVMHAMDLTFGAPEVMRSYVFARILPIGAVGLIGTGVALC